MFNFLHTYSPNAIAISLANINIYWYGLFMILSILAALSISLKIATKTNQSKDKIFDLGFWVIIFGILGARLYHVGLEYQYYLAQPWDIFKLWQGGLAIHGALIAGFLTIYFFCKKNQLNFWTTLAILSPGLALGQAIGRFGNYFNQELFGLPTSLPWGVPIDIMKRPAEYIGSEFFHPTFIYESIGSLIIFSILIYLLLSLKKKNKNNFKIIPLTYLILYSVLRFSLEFIRIDQTLELFYLRWPQIASIIIVALVVTWIIKDRSKQKSS